MGITFIVLIQCSIRTCTVHFSDIQRTKYDASAKITFMFSREHGEWEVTRTDVTSSVISETRNGVTRTHSQLDFWVYLKRRDQFYNTNIMLPMVLSSVLVMLVFTVPVESGEKLSYILTVLLTIAVFLTIIGDTLPAISLTTSILGKFLSFFLSLCLFLSFFLSFFLFFFLSAIYIFLSYLLSVMSVFSG